MKNSLLLCGYGTGISKAVARRFGKEGHPVILIARNAQRLSEAEEELMAEGIQAHGLSADLSDLKAIERTVEIARDMFGPIGILHWNAFTHLDGDLLSASPADMEKSFHIRVACYVAAVQASLNDLQETKGSVLVTSGVIGLDDPKINAFAAKYAALSISITAQCRTTSFLAHTLAPRGIYVGEVIVNGFVAGTPASVGKTSTVAPADVAEQFWDLHTARTTHSAIVGKAVPISTR